MDTKNQIVLLQKSLKLINSSDQQDKEDGLATLTEVLSIGDTRLVELGYKQVILKELIRIVQFDEDKPLEQSLKLIEKYHAQDGDFDELAETLIYRVARSNDIEVCRLCLITLSVLIDHSEDQIAKHSKQLLQLTDLNTMTDLNEILSEVLNKMKKVLPHVKIHSQQ